MNRHVLLCKNLSSSDLHFFKVPAPVLRAEGVSANFACPRCGHVYAYSTSEIKAAKQQFEHWQPRIVKVAFECGTDGCRYPVEVHTPMRPGDSATSILNRLLRCTWHVQCEQRRTPCFPASMDSRILFGPITGNFSYPFRPVLPSRPWGRGTP